MILPEVFVYQSRFLAESNDKVGRYEMRILAGGQTRMTINVLTTMAVTFAVTMAALLVLAGSSLNQAIVAGAVAMGAAFVNLVRRPPSDASDLR
jgi:hypothetical protein